MSRQRPKSETKSDAAIEIAVHELGDKFNVDRFEAETISGFAKRVVSKIDQQISGLRNKQSYLRTLVS